MFTTIIKMLSQICIRNPVELRFHTAPQICNLPVQKSFIIAIRWICNSFFKKSLAKRVKTAVSINVYMQNFAFDKSIQQFNRVVAV